MKTAAWEGTSATLGPHWVKLTPCKANKEANSVNHMLGQQSTDKSGGFEKQMPVCDKTCKKLSMENLYDRK